MHIHPALIAVVGPAEPHLLTAFLRHYADLGVQQFHIAFHFPDDTPHAVREELLTAHHAAIGKAPSLISTGAWHETTNADLRDRLRAQAREGWHLLADLDEFHTYPEPLLDMIAAADKVGSPVIGG